MTVNLLVYQSTYQSISQPISLSANLSVYQSTYQSISQPISLSVNLLVINQPSIVYQSVSWTLFPCVCPCISRVNDRPAGGSQRFNSEPRQRNAGLQSLAPAGARVGGPAVVTEDGRTFLYRSGTSNTRGRQKSLPARKPTGKNLFQPAPAPVSLTQ